MPKSRSTKVRSQAKRPANIPKPRRGIFLLSVPKSTPQTSAAFPGNQPGSSAATSCDGVDCDCGPVVPVSRRTMLTSEHSEAINTLAAHAGGAAANALIKTALAYMAPGVSRQRMQTTRDISVNASEYFGNIGPTDGLEHYAILIAFISTPTSSATGVLNTVFSTDPSQANDWSSYAAIFDEYRVLGLEVTYSPANRYAPVASPGSITQQGPLLVVVDYDDIAAIATFPQAANYSGSAELRNTTDPWRRVVRMAGGPDDNWVTTASPASTFAVKIYGEALSNSLIYGRALVRLLVQFRTTD